MNSLRLRLGKMILDGMVTLLDICPNCQLTSSLTKNIADWLLAAEHLGKSNIYPSKYATNFSIVLEFTSYKQNSCILFCFYQITAGTYNLVTLTTNYQGRRSLVGRVGNCRLRFWQIRGGRLCLPHYYWPNK